MKKEFVRHEISFNMEKEFVIHEISLELKQLGFDDPCFGRIYADGGIEL